MGLKNGYGGCCRRERHDASQDLSINTDAMPPPVHKHSLLMVSPGQVKTQASSAIYADEAQCPIILLCPLSLPGDGLSSL